MNEGISSQLCSLSYIVMDDTAEIALQLGQGVKLIIVRHQGQGIYGI